MMTSTSDYMNADGAGGNFGDVWIHEDTNFSSSAESSSSFRGYSSPLVPILTELRRKHVLAAAATTGPRFTTRSYEHPPPPNNNRGTTTLSSMGGGGGGGFPNNSTTRRNWYDLEHLQSPSPKATTESGGGNHTNTTTTTTTTNTTTRQRHEYPNGSSSSSSSSSFSSSPTCSCPATTTTNTPKIPSTTPTLSQIPPPPTQTSTTTTTNSSSSSSLFGARTTIPSVSTATTAPTATTNYNNTAAATTTTTTTTTTLTDIKKKELKLICPTCGGNQQRGSASSHNTPLPNGGSGNIEGTTTTTTPQTPSQSQIHPKQPQTPQTNKHKHKRRSHHHHHPSQPSPGSSFCEPQHAEALLQSTPHLRHLSLASKDMQGFGNFGQRSNFFNFGFTKSMNESANDHLLKNGILEESIHSASHHHSSSSSSSHHHHSPHSPHPHNNNNNGGGSGSGGSGGGATDMSSLASLDYRSCLIRDKANQQTSMELASFLSVLAHEMSLEDYGSLENEVFTKIFALVHSSDNLQRMAGVTALDALMDAPSADEEKKAIKFANNLTNGLRAPQGDFEFLAAVSKALGHMATGAANVDYVEFEVTRALEWLTTTRSDRRLAACLTLKELALNAPTAFYSKTSQLTSSSSTAATAAAIGHGGSSSEFLDHIFPVLRDQQPIVRACAADALSQCLKIVVERQHVSLTGLLCQVYFDMMEGLAHADPQKSRNMSLLNNNNNNGGGGGGGGGGTITDHSNDKKKKKKKKKKDASEELRAAEAAIHGSLLAVSNMLEYTRDFMLPRFDEVCSAVFGLFDHPKALIRLEVVRLVPRLARKCPSIFGRRYLEKGLLFLLASASTPTSQRVGVDIRPAAFTAVGQLILCMSRSEDGELILGANTPTVRILPSLSPPPTTTAGAASSPHTQVRKSPTTTSRKNSSSNGGNVHNEESAAVTMIIEHSKTGIIYDKKDEIFDLVRSGLQKRAVVSRGNQGAGGASTRSAALHCGADLVEAMGDMSSPYIEDLINDMFGSGLSEDLIQCLHAIATHAPDRQGAIEDRLLQEISWCLAGTPDAKALCDPIAFSRRAAAAATQRVMTHFQGGRKSPWLNRSRSGIPDSQHTKQEASGGGGVGAEGGGSGIHDSSGLLNPVSLFSSQSLGGQQDEVVIRPDKGSGNNASPRITINMSDRQDVVRKLVLSLRTLGSFGDVHGRVTTSGSDVILLPFVRDVAAHYLSHPSNEVRVAAAQTCCTLLVPKEAPSAPASASSSGGGLPSMQSSPHSVLKYRLGGVSGGVIEEVLQKLLQVAVSDPSPVVRLCVVRSLDGRYDPFLCQTHHLQPLFLLVQDEALATRAAGLQLLGRLTKLNPAPILPNLRRILVDLIVELRCGGDTGRGREEATRLFVVFLQSEPLQRLVNPVLPSLVSALPLKGVAPRIASAALEALGELAHASHTQLVPWVKDLIPHILETMQDQSSASKQQISLRTLGQISGSTGYVISPYLDYPQLLSQAADVLPGTKRAPWALRREVIRTLGILGALDPDRYHTVAPKTRKGGAVGGAYFVEQEETEVVHEDVGGSSLMNISSAIESAPISIVQNKEISTTSARQRSGEVSSEKRSEYTSEGEDDMPAHLFMYEMYSMTAQPVSKLPPARRLTPADEEFYPTVAIQALTRIFKDPSLAVHHGMVMQAIMFIFNSLGLRCVPFLDRVVPHIIHTIRTCGPSNLREALLKQIATLSGIVREHLRPYVAAIFDIVEEFWSSRHLGTILSLISKIAAGVPDHFRKYVPRLVRKLLASLEETQVTDWLAPYSRGGVVGSAAYEVEKLELILRSVRSLRSVLGEFMHVLVPALLKLADSLIAHAKDESTLSDVAILTLQTLAVLLERDGTSVSSRANVVSWGEHSSPIVTSCSSLPARAAQPLIRILGKTPTVSRPVGFAIIEILCVCAKQLGSSRWIPLYHIVARDAISSWQVRIGMPIQSDLASDTDGRQPGNRQLKGLLLYEEVVVELELSSRRRIDAPFGSIDGPVPLQRQDSMARNTPDTRANEVLGSYVVENGMGERFDSSTDPLDGDIQNNPSIQPVLNQTSRHRINQGHLQRSWDVSQRASREDWDEWMRRLAIQLLREAPSPALRACASLAHAYQPLARELFSAAFACCWEELSEQYRKNLVDSLEAAFVADVSPEILQTLLNLAEFMEHDGVESGLPIGISILAELALKCRAYAKALHYKEREQSMGGDGSCVEDLISINKKLDLPEAALGVLKAAQVQLEGTSLEYSDIPIVKRNERQTGEHISQHFLRQGKEMLYSVVYSTDNISTSGASWAGVEVQESWLAKLGSWSEALAMYEQKLSENPRDFNAIFGCMKCLDARGEWKRVLQLADESMPAFTRAFEGGTPEAGETGRQPLPSPYSASRMHRKVLKFCAQAAWRLGQWEELEKCASQLVSGKAAGTLSRPRSRNSSTFRDRKAPLVDYDGAFYSAVLHIHRKQWSLATDAIDAARKAMDSRFTALMTESYRRAYPSMVTAQILAEMEEIIEFRKLEGRAKASAHRHPANRPDVEDAREHLLSVWRNRLAGCRVDADVHSQILAVRSLVLGPTDEVEATLTLSDLSRSAQRYRLAEVVLLEPLRELGADLNGPVFGSGMPAKLGLGMNVDEHVVDGSRGALIERLLSGDPSAFLPQYTPFHDQYSKQLVQQAGSLERLTIQHRLYFAFVKHLWNMEHREQAMSRLVCLSDVVGLTSHCEKVEDCSLRVECWLTLGDWKLAQGSSPGSDIAEPLQVDVLTAFKRATSTNGCGYKAWHAWALLNFRIAQQMSGRDEGATVSSGRQRNPASSRSLRSHIVAAVKGFVNAISLGTKRSSASVQQDMLNLLTCLFKWGELPEVAVTINEGLGTIALEAWLGVLPQLLARIHIRSPSVRSVLHPLLTRLGERHPQALMYQLSVLLKSPVPERRAAAESLMNALKGHSSALVEEALMVSSELIRVAILWLETWHEGLEDASRLYFGEGNVSGMLDLLVPLHEQLENGAETRREHDFVKSFGRDLAEAHAYVKEYVRLATRGGASIPTRGGDATAQVDPAGTQVRTSEEAETAMNKAWDIYYQVFRRINKQLPALTKLELNQCSPALSRAQNLELGVPGSYRVDGSYVKIEKFIPSVQVITSKQRPRKITLRGSDGKDYVFLLKGHEDLRQDERVMQLFGLVNALLAKDRRTNKHDLNIKRYAISPLSHNCGVVGWVPHCDTLHSLIRDYRQSKKVPLNMENREMLKTAPDYDFLTVMQKVEVFDEALRRTTGNGNDLYEILWLKSTNSEEWLERRTKFTRSLAVMSMVGYILGLGDRHPSNLMLDSISGRVLHIDFGDCFEVAMNREKYPEKVPFRLTRMLVKAMEVSGIEGSYRSTCERTMGVLRDSRDSLVAMLEAFVYDPLISWRLVGLSSDDENLEELPTPSHMNGGGGGGGGAQTPATTTNNNVVSNVVRNYDSVASTSLLDTSQTLLQQPIREGPDEDGDDITPAASMHSGDGEGNSNNSNNNNTTVGGMVLEGDATTTTATTTTAAAAMAQPRSMGARDMAMSAARARSLQMYSSIQSMAANLSTSSRIASLAGDANNEAAAVAEESSMSRSRVARSLRQREVMSLLEGADGTAHEELLNEKALKVIHRVQDKLTGTDFQDMIQADEPLDVTDQVQRLVVQATSSENLCQLFIGWCAFW